MTEESGERTDLGELQSAVREAVASGRNLQSNVRNLVIATLRSTGVELSEIRKVTRAALEGVGAGIVSHSSGAEARAAIAGIEDALLQAAEASSLAIREAAGRTTRFARTDLVKAVDELASMDRLFLDTFADVAKAGSDSAQAGFADLQQHIRNSGGAFGEQLAMHVDTLRKLLARTGQEGLQSGAGMAGKAAEQLGRLAASLLTGMETGMSGSSAAADRDTGTAGKRDP